MRFLLIIADGMADLPIRKLGGKTPLELAGAENLDMLASSGSSGLMHPPLLGGPPSSDVAILNILGYDPSKEYTGRGPLEAAGAGVDMAKGGIFFRCNLCEIDREGTIINENVNLSPKIWTKVEVRLNSALSEEFEEHEVFFKHTHSYRGVLVIRGSRVSPNVGFPQPKRLESIAKPEVAAGLGGSPSIKAEAEKTAKILNRFREMSSEIFATYSSGSRVLEIIPWGGGTCPRFKDFSKKYGIKAAGIAGVPLFKGICRLCGISVVEVPGATGGPDTNTLAKAEGALKMLQSHKLAMIHIEATDELSHKGDLEGKIEMIKKVDAMVGYLLDRVNLEETRIALLPDHVTSTELRIHTEHPVPVVIAGGGFPTDGLKVYSESSARDGGLGHFLRADLIPTLLMR
ncbi:MAG: alkaline phosphatase family protein [Candidatus Methanosuratincola sp.]